MDGCPQCGCSNATTLWHLDPRGLGAVHSIKRWTGCDRVAMFRFSPKEMTPLSAPCWSRAAQLDARSIDLPADYGRWHVGLPEPLMLSTSRRVVCGLSKPVVANDRSVLPRLPRSADRGRSPARVSEKLSIPRYAPVSGFGLFRTCAEPVKGFGFPRFDWKSACCQRFGPPRNHFWLATKSS
jgi:hypothetical protein